MLAEPTQNDKSTREKMVEVWFDYCLSMGHCWNTLGSTCQLIGIYTAAHCYGAMLSQIMFELHSPPAIFLGRNAALSSFSMGRQTSLVMDCGYSATTGMIFVQNHALHILHGSIQCGHFYPPGEKKCLNCLPDDSFCAVAAVHEGYVLQKSVCRAPLGGETLNQCMQSAVEHANNLEIRPRYSFTRKETFAGTWEVRHGTVCIVSRNFRLGNGFTM